MMGSLVGSFSPKSFQKKSLPPPTADEITASKVPSPSEREGEMAECRRCLLPGMSRSCCNEYYCDKCYYENTMCANCGQQVADAADQDRDQLGRLVHMSDSNAAQQLCAWALKGSVVLLVLVVPWLLLGLDAVLGVPTMHGYRCQGPFSGGCNKELCRLMYREVNGSLREVVRAGGAVGMVGVVGVNSSTVSGSTVGGSAVNGSAGATSLVSAAAAAPMLHQVRRKREQCLSHAPLDQHSHWQRRPPAPRIPTTPTTPAGNGVHLFPLFFFFAHRPFAPLRFFAARSPPLRSTLPSRPFVHTARAFSHSCPLSRSVSHPDKHAVRPLDCMHEQVEEHGGAIDAQLGPGTSLRVQPGLHCRLRW